MHQGEREQALQGVEHRMSVSASIKVLVLAPHHQELGIEHDVDLQGSGLEVLPRCCPFLKTLRLQQLPSLTDCFLPAVQQLAVRCTGYAWLMSSVEHQSGDKNIHVLASVSRSCSHNSTRYMCGPVCRA